MELCDYDHDEVCFEKGVCPVCEKEEERENMESERDDWETKHDDMEADFDDLTEQAANFEQSIIDDRPLLLAIIKKAGFKVTYCPPEPGKS